MTMDELAQTQQTQPQRPPRYVVVTEPDGKRRVARADGLPLGTPFVRTTPPPAPRVTARGFLAALRRGTTTQRGGKAPAADDATVPTGEELRRRREAAGLGQRDLAAMAGVSRGLLSEIETGGRNAPDGRRKIGAALARFEGGKAAAPVDAPPVPWGE